MSAFIVANYRHFITFLISHAEKHRGLAVVNGGEVETCSGHEGECRTDCMIVGDRALSP